MRATVIAPAGMLVASLLLLLATAPAAAQDSMPRVVRPARPAAPATDAPADEPVDPHVEAIARLDEQWLTAPRRADQATAESILAPEATILGPDGQLRDRAAALASLADVVPASLDTGRIEDVEVQLDGDAAAESRGVLVQQEPIRVGASVYRYHHRWRLRNGRWQLVRAELRTAARRPSPAPDTNTTGGPVTGPGNQ